MNEMNDLKSGMFVQHASLGLGKVVAVEPGAVHVFFDASESRFATKLRLPMAAPLLRPTNAKNAWLAATSPFARDARSGRFALAQSWVPEREAIARFDEAFPDGFADPQAAPGGKGKRERARAEKWWAANAAYSELFGAGEGERLLADGKLAELVRRALRVERHLSALYPAPDKVALTQALEDPSGCGDYFAALFALLAAPAAEKRARFEDLARAVGALPRATPGVGWVVATVLPAIAQPDRHVLLRPKAICDAAHRLGFDVKYDAEPNWRTYDAVLGVAKVLLERLRSARARDFVDVESFVHEIVSRRPKAAAPAEALA
jgi:hypothetical protein